MGTTVLRLDVLPDYQLRLFFLNGSEAVINMRRRVKSLRFRCLAERKLFETARLERDEVVWDDGGKMIRASVNELLDTMQME
jgi:hypothetical protein